MDTIRIRGARTHNLKNIDLDLPRDSLIVITGLSGSGKSSLAFDTIYAEGQRRYVESLSAYARQFLSVMEKPDVDHIEGLSPAISIEQKSTSHNPRSTVGTITEVYDYLRLLFARVGTPRCPDHGIPLEAQTVSQMVDTTLAMNPERRYMLLAPVVRERKGEHLQVFEQLRAQGFVRARVNGELYELDAVPALALRQKHTIEAVIDRFRPNEEIKQRLAESFETALRLGDGIVLVVDLDDANAKPVVFSSRFSCPICDYSLPELEPRLFSFNSPVGACPSCDGLGVTQVFDPARVVVHPNLSLAAGAVRGWDRRNMYYFQLIMSLARHYQFNIDSAWETLPENIRQAILSGSGDEQITFRYLTETGGSVTRKHKFEGIVPNLERRYKEIPNRPPCARNFPSSSANVPVPNAKASASIVARAMCSSPTITCRRSRRCRSTSRSEVLPWAHARRLARPGGGEDRQGNPRAPALPRGRGPRLPDARSRGRLAVGRRGTRHPPRVADRRGTRRRDVRARRAVNWSAPARQRASARHPYAAARPRQHGHRRRTRRGSDPAGRLRRRPRTRSGRARRRDRRAGTMLKDVLASQRSITGEFLSGKRGIEVPRERRKPDPQLTLRITGASGNNLKNVDLEIPAGLFVCVTGVSGSGKSTLINDTLFRHGRRTQRREREAGAVRGKVERLEPDRQGRRHRPVADRTHAAQQSGNLHRPVPAAARLPREVP